MLRLQSDKPCKLVYALCKHEYLGYLIEPHVVQLNANGSFSLTYQRLFSNTAKEFASILDETDYQLIKLLEEMEQTYLIKKYYKKSIRPVEFFTKVFTPQLFEVYRPKIEKKLVEALALLGNKPLYLMGKEGWPVEKRIQLASEGATVLFHFRRNETETRYFPTIKYQGQRIEFMFKEAQVICNQPAWLLVENMLYFFEDDIEGKKLQPFLNKRFIAIPRASEKTYFEKFVAPLIEKHHVYAEGFTIIPERYEAVPVLKVVQLGDFTQLQLHFKYGDYVFQADTGKRVSVRMEQQGEETIFHRVKRSLTWEKTKIDALVEQGLRPVGGLYAHLEVNTNQEENTSPIEWINTHHDWLVFQGFELKQSGGDKTFVLGSSRINLEVKESNDWFDIEATVWFGPYEIPFMALKNHILKRIKEFTLPGGEIAVIPEKWFSQYSNLFHFSEGKNELKLKKHHIGLVNDIANSELAAISMDRKLQKLANFEGIESVSMPKGFKGTLRPYQEAGYHWFNFLRKYHFGGCLADDMGLGKTVQALALLQQLKEEHAEEGATSLIIMPTSLIYNWEREAAKFAPKLKILVYAGALRNKDISRFSQYDVVLSTYGISRVDADLLSAFYFHYIILDESQNIKNAASKAFKAIRQFKSKNRLILSGTPIENSVNDLWTQMSFINPGLLGSQHYFQEEFVYPIEKKKDEEKALKLQALIKPFVLRRTKNQVATELPPKTEHVFYCEMSAEQASIYEEIKSSYRNELMQSIADGTVAKKQVEVLQGLTKLRQIANHPKLIQPDYEGESGKFENVIHTLDHILANGHKVLVFSQFVRQLDIYRKHFDKEGIRYAYLDGQTRNRSEVVDSFKQQKDIQLFLISLKAGGVGLNLTEADYVFMLDPWWNPAVEQQAIDRTHRIGQQKNVFIYKFISKNTVEEKILALQDRKKKVAQALITTEDHFEKSLSAADIEELLR
jgi:superfamily II DNA or RNA helicase